MSKLYFHAFCLGCTRQGWICGFCGECHDCCDCDDDD